MFPYPSGEGMHIGHFYNYAIIDSYCNYLRHTGQEVFQPFGYDAFGLPAENYARKIGGDPATVTDANIKNFDSQLQQMNTKYQTLINTSKPEYVKWTQWLFKKLQEHGKAYKAFGDVNWCPSCETVLAREQVKNGSCDRCGSSVIVKQLNQWYFKISDYAERLYNNLDTLDWPKKTIKAQKEWIGKSEGYEIDFKIDGSDKIITVFTTKPETICNVEFIAVSRNSEMATKADDEYFTEHYAINPVTSKKIPIYVANYIIEGYGTSYVMGVPSSDNRDNAFASRHGISTLLAMPDYIIVDGNDSFIRKKTNYKLRDWCVSRQRKWGCPIPVEGETDTLDTFVDSSFYYIRYCDAFNSEELCSKEKFQAVDLYVGGAEHACMHLIYARFICMFLHDIGVVPIEEPFKRLVHQGMILNNSEKMSKSKGNVIDPTKYDCDELKFYLMFIGHYFDGGSWSDQNINGVKRFIANFKKWMNLPSGEEQIDIDAFEEQIFNFTKSFKFNKVVSSFMILLNNNKTKQLHPDQRERLVKLLQIYMPGFKSSL